ncbi:MAG: protein translocase subunit SecF [Candidatus Levyibacteriota bacterium]
MDIVGKRNWFFLGSLLIIIPGIIFLIIFGLNLSIDFTGGSRLTFSLPKAASTEEVNKIKNAFEEEKIKVATIEKSNNLVFVRTQPIDQAQDAKVVNKIKSELKNFKQEEFETIGPTIGAETTSNAVKAVIIASILIVLYITFSFRQVPKPASSFRFGICAIIALVHDVLVVMGAFALFGHFFGVEIDSLFVTAILTVIGFSVHDTIVVFDRIRENLKRMGGTSFPQVVNDSILQTIDRSLNTSLTVVLVLLAMFLFGGESIKWFVVALLIGIVSGTYSSIFNAAAILVVWQNWSVKRKALKKIN